MFEQEMMAGQEEDEGEQASGERGEGEGITKAASPPPHPVSPPSLYTDATPHPEGSPARRLQAHREKKALRVALFSDDLSDDEDEQALCSASEAVEAMVDIALEEAGLRAAVVAGGA